MPGKKPAIRLKRNNSLALKSDRSGFMISVPFWQNLIDFGSVTMSGLDNLIAFIDNGGTRSGSERRRSGAIERRPERRIMYDRRSGADRRRILNKKRQTGKERRTIFIDSR